jgi:tetratricopeptide (TPR) repeat protein
MSSEPTRIVLPEAPAALTGAPVKAWREPVQIDTYEAAAPDRYPAYLDQRVYQGSSGAVYPLPFIDAVAREKAPRRWDAIHLENEYVRLMILPELGGRIHIGLDKTRGYDFFYRNDVIKPALVGLAGPWVSGGVEFNWPQHHRPATHLPVETRIEPEDDGSATVWCSDHDPFARMQGMHGVRLRPASALIELRGHLVNRTDEVQTFLWWANVAAKAGEGYQSFFPTDVRTVADHAKRATTAFPGAQGHYYGVDYPARRTPERPDGDRLDWYRNIPVPTSYMCLGSEDDFFGGYDHGARAGFVHWADHRTAPGKKQWTWGNAPFGWAWDAHLTDDGGPYVELMAGVFTDNQPDFAFLRPGETKTFSQYWYPIQDTGPVHQATREAAVRLDLLAEEGDTRLRIAAAVTEPRSGARVVLRSGDRLLHEATTDIAPGSPYLHESTDELYLTGLHLAQYRHATRRPEPYWEAALRRDPGDARCNTALAGRLARAGRLDAAEAHLRAAVARSTLRNPNPRDGEAHYRLGLVLARQGRDAEAKAAFGTASWDASWADAAAVATARLDLAAGGDDDAAAALEAVVARSPRHTQARNLLAVAVLRGGDRERATALVRDTLRDNPLDAWARDLAHRLGGDAVPTADPTIALDVAREYRSIREDAFALDLFDAAARLAPAPGQVNVAPLTWLYRADLEFARGDVAAADLALQRVRDLDRTWCFPSAADNDALARLRSRRPDDAVLAGLAGHWLYAADRRREAIEAWETAAPTGDPVVLRNLGVAAHNVQGDPERAAHWYGRARAAAPADARLLYESDQLDARRGVGPERRLAVLNAHRDLVGQRDDLSVQLAELLTAARRPSEAIDVLSGRAFQPWEGGEGRVLAAWEAAHLALARDALAAGDAGLAVARARAALDPDPNLGEARHLLANTADLHLALGDALAAAGDPVAARSAWEQAATQQGDFQTMQVQAHSEHTAAAVTALRRLGKTDAAQALRDDLARYIEAQARTEARIDYFATSLPTMLLFTTDVQAAHDTRVLVLRAQLAHLDGDPDHAAALAGAALERDPLNGAARALAPTP